MAENNKKLGVWTSASLIVGNMIGAGVFMLPVAMSSFGSIGLLGWVVAAIGTFFLAKVFGGLSRALPGTTGGPYIYTRVGLGDFAGFLIAWGYYLSCSAGNAAITLSFVGAVSKFFPALTHNNITASLTGIAVIWLLTAVNLLGVIATGRMQLITTILKLIPIFAVAAGGLFFIKSANFLPFNPGGVSPIKAITTTASMAMFAFIGIECASIPAGSVADPERTIPRATNLGLLISTIVYLLGSVVMMGMFSGTQLSHSVMPYADAAEIIFGHGTGLWVSAGVAIAAFGSINGWILMQGHMPYAVAKDKLFPPVFARLNKKGVPWFGIVLNGLITSAFFAMNYTLGLAEQFQSLLLLSVLCTLIPYLFSSASYLILALKQKRTNAGTGAVAVGFLGFIYSLWTIIGSGKDAVYSGFILLMAAIPFYVWMANQKKTAENAPS